MNENQVKCLNGEWSYNGKYNCHILTNSLQDVQGPDF